MEMRPFKRARVSTRELPENLPENKRLSMWSEARQAKWHALFGTSADCEMVPTGNAPFRAEMSVTILPDLIISHFRRSPGREAVGKTLNGELVLFGFLRSGSAIMSQRGKVISKPRSVSIATSEHSWESVVHSEASLSGLAVSRAAIAHLVPGVSSAFGTAIPAEHPALRLLIPYLDMVQTGQGFPTFELARSASTHILDLAALALGARGDAAELATLRGAKAARFAAVTADIRAMVGNGKLSAEDIAARHQITPRYVRKLFEEAGSSFSTFVLTERLEKIRRMLADRRNAHLSISDIAYESGFGDLSYFNRAFKRHFGATPSDFRQMSRDG